MMEEREKELNYIADQIREPYEQWKNGDPGVQLDPETIIQNSLKHHNASKNSY